MTRESYRDHNGIDITVADIDHTPGPPCPPDLAAAIERSARAVDRAMVCQYVHACDECGRHVDPDTEAAPSCGAHIVHIECAGYFGCRECIAVQREAGFVPC